MLFHARKDTWGELQQKASALHKNAERTGSYLFEPIKMLDSSRKEVQTEAFMLVTPRVGNLAQLRDGTIVERPADSEHFRPLVRSNTSEKAARRVIENLDNFLQYI